MIFLISLICSVLFAKDDLTDKENYLEYLCKAEKQYDVDSFIKTIEIISAFDQTKKYEVLVANKLFERIFKLQEKYLKVFYSREIFKLHSSFRKMIDGYAEYGPMINELLSEYFFRNLFISLQILCELGETETAVTVMESLDFVEFNSVKIIEFIDDNKLERCWLYDWIKSR